MFLIKCDMYSQISSCYYYKEYKHMSTYWTLFSANLQRQFYMYSCCLSTAIFIVFSFLPNSSFESLRCQGTSRALHLKLRSICIFLLDLRWYCVWESNRIIYVNGKFLNFLLFTDITSIRYGCCPQNWAVCFRMFWVCFELSYKMQVSCKHNVISAVAYTITHSVVSVVAGCFYHDVVYQLHCRCQESGKQCRSS